MVLTARAAEVLLMAISRTMEGPSGGGLMNVLNTPPQEDPRAQLERAFIEEFLRSRHQTLETVKQLPAGEADALLHEASLFASGRLAEVESRAHLIDELHRLHDPAARQPHGGTGQTTAEAIPDVSPPPHRQPVPVPTRRPPLRWFF
jgi:hypothetical protein